MTPEKAMVLWARLCSDLGRRAGELFDRGQPDAAFGLVARQARARERFWDATKKGAAQCSDQNV